MKINAQEIVLLNRRNMKNGESAPQTTTETTVSNPEETIKALELQGKNNLAFQGVNNAILKQIGKKVVLPLAIAGGALAAQSCDGWIDPYGKTYYPVDNDRDTTVVNVTTQVTVGVSITIINNQSDELANFLMQWMTGEYKAQFEALLEEIKGLRADVNSGLANLAESQQRIYELQLQAFELMKLAYANDVEMNEKLANIEARIEGLKAAVEAGEMTYAQASEEIKKILASINGKLDDVVVSLKDIFGAINDFKAMYEADRAKAFDYLAGIYKNGEINNRMLQYYGEYVVAMNNSVKMIKENTDKLIKQSETNHNELIETIKNASAEEMAMYKEMFAFYGLTIEDVINMSAEKLVALLKDFKTNYEKTEGKQVELLLEINENLQFLSQWPGLDSEAIQAALEGLRGAVDKNTEVVAGKLEGIQASLDALKAAVNKLVCSVAVGFDNLEAYHKEYAENWAKLLAYANDFDGDLETLKNDNKDIKFFLNEQLKELQAIRDAIKELDIAAGGDGTGCSCIEVEELRQMLENLGDKYLAAFEKVIVDNKLDLGNIEDLLKVIEEKIGNLQQPIDYSDDLATIISLIKANPNLTAEEIEEIIKKYACNCEHGGSNEGIIGDLEGKLQ